MSIPESVFSEFVPVPKGSSVEAAVNVMVEHNVGSVVVMEGDAIAGIFTERDLMKRVVHQGLDPKETLVANVMTSQVLTIDRDAMMVELLTLMDDHHIRHVPVVKDGKPHAMITMRRLQRNSLKALREENETLTALLVTDGPGG